MHILKGFPHLHGACGDNVWGEAIGMCAQNNVAMLARIGIARAHRPGTTEASK
jgi:hypothetical protein